MCVALNASRARRCVPLDDALARAAGRMRTPLAGTETRFDLRRRRPRAGAGPRVGAAGAAAGQQLDGRLRGAQRRDCRRRRAAAGQPAHSRPAARPQPLAPGSAARIFTGAPIPDGRRCRRDAGRHRAPPASRWACASCACPSRASGSAAAARTCTRGARRAGAGRAPDAGRRWAWRPASAWTSCRWRAARASRCSPPATNS